MRSAFVLLLASLSASSASATAGMPDGSPRLGSDDCPASAALSCLSPTQDSGTTVGANDTVSQLVNGCQGVFSMPGPDVAYKIKVGIQDVTFPTFIVFPSAGYDVALYVLSSAAPGCPAGMTNAVTNCVRAVNNGGPGVSEQIPFEFSSLPAGDYYLFIDSPIASGPGSSGTYTVLLNKLCPVELIEYSVD